ncbi:MAG: hypothetical protein CL663_02660 [Bacteroidetes bacterium]|nr:hypothetical protein [Bacteroidota bacterium]
MPGLFIKRHALSVSEHVDISVIYVHADDHLDNDYETVQDLEEGLITIRVYFKKAKGIFGPIRNGFRYLKAQSKAFKLLLERSSMPDLIHVHVLTRNALYAYWHLIKNKIPYVITEHWTRYLPENNGFKGSFRKLITKEIVKKSSAVLPVTYNLANAMQNHSLKNDNYKIIPNVVDTERFISAIGKKENKKKRIIHISCFTDQQKNISGILHTLHDLSKNRTDFKMIFIGEGEDLEHMKELCSALQLDHIVEFKGLLEDDYLVQEVQKADLQVLFSNYENLPVVILEGFACGVPIISTDTGGIKEHIYDFNGSLVSIADSNAFKSKIEEFLDGRHTYNPDMIRVYAVKKFSNSAIGKALYEIYLKDIEE